MPKNDIDSKLKQAYALIKECEDIATSEGLEFSFDVAYGMGGTFYGEPFKDYYGDTRQGWQASSHSC